MEIDMTWGGEHTVQYTDDVLQSCTPETNIILLTNITPINSIFFNKRGKQNIQRNKVQIIKFSKMFSGITKQRMICKEPNGTFRGKRTIFKF